MQRSAEQRRAGGATVVVSARGTGSAEPTWEIGTRAWIDRRADRSRIESTGGTRDSLSVRRGRLWWSYTPQSGSVSNESDPEVHGVGMQDLDWLLDPSLLLATFDFEPRGRTEMAGRRALEVMAVPRPADPRRGLGGFLARGGDAVVLAVDAERGVVLRSEVRLENRPFALTEIVEVAFDKAFADDLFEFVSPDGSPIRSPRGTFPPPVPVSIEEAARRASFTVLVPRRLPRGWSVEASYIPASERPGRPESVHVQILGGDGRESRMRLHESAEALPDHLGWQEVERRGPKRPLPRSWRTGRCQRSQGGARRHPHPRQRQPRPPGVPRYRRKPCPRAASAAAHRRSLTNQSPLLLRIGFGSGGLLGR